ncbi:zinc finger CCCH domain-containing protein 16 isoform X1 [Senna tora]|uniref:Zinc finger CCCH domain-containing protein 16 isoform X1 n=1 Tax=Senna tora TaxID=362788 RepID=A0A834W0G1_9FABA|nr:zinc finger CCCH domain-containing protein 16 isoform X1 [Senna tora]
MCFSENGVFCYGLMELLKLSSAMILLLPIQRICYRVCQYGERCKFLHVLPQQQRSNVPALGHRIVHRGKQNSNPFGFGSHAGSQQQNKTNPFGFGVQNSSQSRGGADLEFKQQQFKVLPLPIY